MSDSLPSKFSFVDIETTGGNFTRDRIIEIGVVRVEQDKVVKEFNSLINPGTCIPAEIELLTGISQIDVDNAPSFYELKKDLFELLSDSVFVAHNVRFDYSFLKYEFSRFDLSFSPKQLCTVKLSRKLYPEYRQHNLDSIIERFNIKCKSRHRAFDDAKVLFHFYKKIRKSFSREILEPAVKAVMKQPSLPTRLGKEMLDSLPEGPGVYIFYGANRSVLYVGKSKNIRERVLSHFSSDHSSPKEMRISQQIENIECIQSAGELGALLLESKLVKELQPLFNRKLRILKRLTIAKTNINKSGYKEVVLEDLDTIYASDLENVIAIFKSKKRAKEFLINRVKQFFLCEKLLGLEKTSSGCFSYRLGSCRGACVGKESAQIYNLRHIMAFTAQEIRQWPFEGSIEIKETNPLTKKSEVFIVNNWCLVTEAKSELVFDLDAYKILSSYIRSDKNMKRINIVKKSQVLEADMSFESA